MNTHLQQVGLQLSEQLTSQYDNQISDLIKNVEQFNTDMEGWEVGIIDDLSDNMEQFKKFRDDVGDSLETMSKSVNSKYRLTREY